MKARIDPNNLAGAVAYLQRCDPTMKGKPVDVIQGLAGGSKFVDRCQR